MNISWRTIAHFFVAVLGIILMAVGILTGKHGATVIGLIISAVAVQQWLKGRNPRTLDEKKDEDLPKQ